MTFMIDPPVSPFSPPERIREWIAELERWLEEDAETTSDRASILEEIARAERWLAAAEDRG